MREKNPIRIMKMQDPITKEFKLRCNLYLGGKSGEKVYYGKPVIYDDDNPHFMYPNEARLRNMTYAMTVHYDVDVEYFIEGETTRKSNRRGGENSDRGRYNIADKDNNIRKNLYGTISSYAYVGFMHIEWA